MVREPVTNKERLLLLLYKYGKQNTAFFARKMGRIYIYVRRLLYELKDQGYVDSEYVRRYYPGITWIMTHEWWITDLGKKWLKDQELI